MSQTSPFGRTFNYESSCFMFPGDEQIEQGMYGPCLENWYVGILPDLEAGAAAHGITLDNASAERGRRMLTGQFWLDDMIDRDPADDDTMSDYERIVRSLLPGHAPAPLPSTSKPELDTAVRLLRNANRTLPEPVQQQIVEGGLRIQALTAHQVATASIRTYIAKQREEGRISGELIAYSLGSAEGEVPASYKRWLGHVVACLSLLDHASDLHNDYANNLTGVAPTRRHQAMLAAAGIASLSATLTTRVGRKATRQAFRQPVKAFKAYRQLR